MLSGKPNSNVDFHILKNSQLPSPMLFDLVDELKSQQRNLGHNHTPVLSLALRHRFSILPIRDKEFTETSM